MEAVKPLKNFVNLEYIKSLDVSTQEYKEVYSIKLDKESIRGGVLKEIGATPFLVYMSIISFMDSEGLSYPSIDKLQEITGLSRMTIIEAIKKLLELKVLCREYETLGAKKGKFSVYKLAEESEESDKLKDIIQIKESKEEEKEEEKEVKPVAPVKSKPKTSRDYVELFKELYFKEFDTHYLVNYGRDCSLIKSKLMPNFTEQQINRMIIYTIKHYKENWYKPAYPRPTISQLCGWLGNSVINIIQEEDARQEELIKAISMSKDLKESTENNMELFDSI